MPSEILLSHVAKTFSTASGGPLRVLDDITFTVPRGSFVSILGGNGYGKSTLLRAISGIDPQTEGEILINGRARKTGQVGMISQEASLFPWRTAIQNIEFGLEIAGVPKSERRLMASSYLEAFGLANFADVHPRELSGGMRQKVAIARALATSPDVILMDEPFSALDFQTRANLQCFILKLWSNRRETILFVTHDVDEAILMSDMIVILSPIPSRVVKTISIDLPRPRRNHGGELAGIREELLRWFAAPSCQEDLDALNKRLNVLSVLNAGRLAQ